MRRRYREKVRVAVKIALVTAKKKERKLLFLVNNRMRRQIIRITKTVTLAAIM